MQLDDEIVLMQWRVEEGSPPEVGIGHRRCSRWDGDSRKLGRVHEMSEEAEQLLNVRDASLSIGNEAHQNRRVGVLACPTGR